MSWDKLSLREKAAYIRTGVKNGLTDINDIKGAYNSFAEGGPEDTKEAIEYAHNRFPATRNIKVNVVHDSNFTPKNMGDIEYLPANRDQVNYGDYTYNKPNNLRGQSVEVYNDALNGDLLNEAVALDMMSHGLREQDPTYRQYLNKYSESRQGYDPSRYADEKYRELHNKGFTDPYSDIYGSFIDGEIRDYVVKDNLRSPLKYGPKEDTKWYTETPAQESAMRGITTYLQDPGIGTSMLSSYNLPEFTVTAKKKSYGGNLFDGGGHIYDGTTEDTQYLKHYNPSRHYTKETAFQQAALNPNSAVFALTPEQANLQNLAKEFPDIYEEGIYDTTPTGSLEEVRVDAPFSYLARSRAMGRDLQQYNEQALLQGIDRNSEEFKQGLANIHKTYFKGEQPVSGVDPIAAEIVKWLPASRAVKIVGGVAETSKLGYDFLKNVGQMTLKAPYVGGSVADQIALRTGAQMLPKGYAGARTVAGALTNMGVDSYFAAQGIGGLINDGVGEYGENLGYAALGLTPLLGGEYREGLNMLKNDILNAPLSFRRKVVRPLNKFYHLSDRTKRLENDLLEWQKFYNDIDNNRQALKFYGDIPAGTEYNVKYRTTSPVFEGGIYKNPFTGKSTTVTYPDTNAASITDDVMHLDKPIESVKFDFFQNSPTEIAETGNKTILRAPGLYTSNFDYFTKDIPKQYNLLYAKQPQEAKQLMQEYVNELQSRLGQNIGISGSTLLAKEGLIPKIPGDIEMVALRGDIDRINKVMQGNHYHEVSSPNGLQVGKASSEMAAGKEGTYDIDILETVDNNPNSNVKGRLAHQIYAMLHPEEYQAIREQMAMDVATGKASRKKDFDTFDFELPISGKQLLSEYNQGDNPLRMQIANYLSSTNSKHTKYVDYIISNPEYAPLVRNTIINKGRGYIKNYQSAEQAYPYLDLSDVKANEELLKELKYDTKLASDKEVMRTIVEKLHFDNLHGRASKEADVWNGGVDWETMLNTNTASQTGSGAGGNSTFGPGGGTQYGSIAGLFQRNYLTEKIKKPIDLVTENNRIDRNKHLDLSKEDVDKVIKILQEYEPNGYYDGIKTIGDVDNAIVNSFRHSSMYLTPNDVAIIRKKGEATQRIADALGIRGTIGSDYYSQGRYFGVYDTNYNTRGLAWQNSEANRGQDAYEIGSRTLDNPLLNQSYTTGYVDMEKLLGNLDGIDMLNNADEFRYSKGNSGEEAVDIWNRYMTFVKNLKKGSKFYRGTTNDSWSSELYNPKSVLRKAENAQFKRNVASSVGKEVLTASIPTTALSGIISYMNSDSDNQNPYTGDYLDNFNSYDEYKKNTPEEYLLPKRAFETHHKARKQKTKKGNK